jgi:two-component system, OmpR family, phosphate regulon sensor histidine kinase PhoR
MRFLWRNAVFILFPAVVVAIIFLAMMNIGMATQFGEWGERSMAESAMIVTKDKIERVEHTIRNRDEAFFSAVDPEHVDTACDRWRKVISDTDLIKAAVIVDEYDDIVAFFYKGTYGKQTNADLKFIQDEVLPLVDKYDSYNQYKHIHKQINGEYVFFSHFTRFFGAEDYTTCLIYDTGAIVDELLASVLENVGEDRVANVVDDHNQTMFGRPIDGAEEFIVARRFPSTLYKWRLQLAPTKAALFQSRAQERAKVFSKALLIPLALFVIALSLVVLYLSVVRERRLNRLKSEFVANVTHELKTPLSLIRMFGELLLLGKVEDREKTRRYYEIILREAERLTSLIDNVLNLARIERGKSAYEFAEASVTEAVERGVEITRHNLEKQGLRLEYHAHGDLAPVYIDERAITLAVVNLIDNAVKYAAGTPLVGIEVEGLEKEIRIDIYDRGAGIPTSQIRRVFERFYRVPTAETRKQRGSGIGLSLVRHIAEGHGGHVNVTSNTGVETRFSIHLPAVRDGEGLPH